MSCIHFRSPIIICSKSHCSHCESKVIDVKVCRLLTVNEDQELARASPSREEVLSCVGRLAESDAISARRRTVELYRTTVYRMLSSGIQELSCQSEAAMRR